MELSPSRSFDYEELDRTVADVKEQWIGFDARLLVEDEDNVLVTDGEGNFGLFEFESPGVYYGHYLFAHRGIRVEKIARELLGFFFKEFPVYVVLGLTPVEHKGAIKLNKKLGFTFHEVVETEAGPHHYVSLTKDDFRYE